MSSSEIQRDDFLFHRVKDQPTQQVDDAQALDSHLLQLFSIASLLIGLAGFSRPSAADAVPASLVLAAIAAYGAGAVFVLLALPMRLRRQPVEFDADHDGDGDADVGRLERDLSTASKLLAEHNDALIRRKLRAFRIALTSTGIEVSCIGLSFVSAQTDLI